MRTASAGFFVCCLAEMAHASSVLGFPPQEVKVEPELLSRTTLGEGDPRTSSPITALVYSTQGDHLAAGCKDGSIHVWATTPFALRFKWSFHKGQIASLAAAPTLGLLASASDDGSVSLWNLKTGKQVRNWKVDPAGLRSVAFSPNSQRLVTVGRSTAARLWDVESGGEIATFQDPSPEGFMAQFSPTSKTIACCRNKGLIDLLDADSGKLQRSITAHAGWIAHVRYSPDGKTLASYGQDGLLKVWNTETWQAQHQLKVPHAAEIDLAYSADGAWLAMCGNIPEQFRMWELATGNEIGPIVRLLRGVSAIAFSALGKTLATGGPDLTVRLWRREQGLIVCADRKGPSDCWAMDLSGDGSRVSFGGSESAVYEWDIKTRQHLRTATFEDESVVTTLRYSSKDGVLTVGSEGGTLGLWSAGSKELLESRPTHDTVRSMAGNPTTSTFIAGLSSGIFLVWDIPNNKELMRVSAHKGEVRALDYCANSKFLISGGTDGVAKVWDCTTWKALRAFREHQKDVSAVAGNAVNDLVASADWTGRLLLWKATTGDVLGELRKPSETVCMALSFSPDAKTLAAGGNDGKVTLYEVSTMKEMTRVGFDKRFVRVIRFLPGVFRFAAGLSDGLVDIFDPKHGLNTAELTKEQFGALWDTLRGPDASAAFDAMLRLQGNGGTTASLIYERQPAVDLRESQIKELTQRLDSEDPNQRADAFAHCETIGPHPDLLTYVRASGSTEAKAAIDRLKLFENSPSTTPALLRFSRAVAILESMGSPEAREVLIQWSKGAATSPLTRDASAALLRLSGKK